VCGWQPITAALLHFLRVNAQMHNLDLAKNGARPQNVSGNRRDNFSLDKFSADKKAFVLKLRTSTLTSSTARAKKMRGQSPITTNNTNMFEEYEILTKKLEKILPFKAYPTRELVVQLRDKILITLKSELLINSVHNSNDIGGIICAIKMKNKEVLACGLTHLIIPSDNQLFKEILEYQTKRIKRLKKLNQR
jgi:hypothetical protein